MNADIRLKAIKAYCCAVVIKPWLKANKLHWNAAICAVDANFRNESSFVLDASYPHIRFKVFVIAHHTDTPNSANRTFIAQALQPSGNALS